MALTNQEILALQQHQYALQQMMAQQQAVNTMPFGIAAGAANALLGTNVAMVGAGGAFYPMVPFVNGGEMRQPAPPLEPLPTGMKVEDLIGWRIWRVTNGHLWSFSYDYAWMPGDVSEGEPGDHDHAGVWAFKDKRRAFQKAVESGVGHVWGSVRLWGHVVEHKDGYRASKARIVSLDGCTRDITPEMMTDLCRLYRVPEVEVPRASFQPTQPVHNRVAVWKVLPSSPSINPTPTAISDDGSVLVGASPPTMEENRFTGLRPDTPGRTFLIGMSIWILGIAAWLIAALPLMLRR